VKLTNSGTVEGYVRRPNGAGVQQCDVYVNGVRVGNSLAGRFLLRGVPVGQVNIKATERQTGLTGSTSGTLVETGGKLSLDVVLPPTGTLKGRLLAADGATPLAQLPVTLGILNAENVGLRDADTDADGFFFFPDVPAGAFTLSAGNPDTGAAATSEGQILTDGEQVTINLRLMPVGIVTGRVTGWDAKTPVAQTRVELIASDGRFLMPSQTGWVVTLWPASRAETSPSGHSLREAVEAARQAAPWRRITRARRQTCA